MKGNGFSLYDIEDFLKDAGAEEVNEKVVFCLKRELEELTNELIESSRVYANYAGRKRVKKSDVLLAKTSKSIIMTKTVIATKRKHSHP